MTNAGETLLEVGAIVRTSYGSGPYVVESLSGPCCCSNYLDVIDGRPKPSKPHFHMGCRHLSGRGGDYYLNGYRLDGTSVWSRDRLHTQRQLELFA